MFGTEKLTQIGAAFRAVPPHHRHGARRPAEIDQAARQYADAIASVTGAEFQAVSL